MFTVHQIPSGPGRSLAGLALLVLCGCASNAGLDATPLRLPSQLGQNLNPQLSIGGVVADRDLSRDWFNGQLSLSGPLQLMQYQAEYVVDGGDVLSRIDGATATPLTAAPINYAGELLKQSMSTTLPSLAGGAPRLSFTSVEGSRWDGQSEIQQREQKATLSWNPAPLGFELDWAAPRLTSDAARPLDCSLGGRLRLGLAPLGARDQSLSMGARNCQVDAPARVASELGVDSWSTSWQFGKPRMRHALSLTLLETAPATHVHDEAQGTGYELRFAQTRTQGSWVGDSAVGLRRVDDFVGSSDQTVWIAQANLRRQIRRIGITAGWQRDADPLWFVPGVAAPVDQLAVGLDLRQLVAQQIGAHNLLNANLTYSWNRSDDPALDGSAIYWNLTKAW